MYFYHSSVKSKVLHLRTLTSESTFLGGGFFLGWGGKEGGGAVTEKGELARCNCLITKS